MQRARSSHRRPWGAIRDREKLQGAAVGCKRPNGATRHHQGLQRLLGLTRGHKGPCEDAGGHGAYKGLMVVRGGNGVPQGDLFLMSSVSFIVMNSHFQQF
jgi:hypothetical protein